MEHEVRSKLWQFKTSLSTFTLASLLCACAPKGSLGYLESVAGALRHSFAASIPPGSLKPGFEYLLIEIDGRKTAMALGSRQEVVEAGQVLVHEHWYSGHREMIHMVNGRIHTAFGLTVEWRRQQSSPPSWSALSDANSPLGWQRELDIMPGYRFGQTDRIGTQASIAPQGAPSQVAGTRWFSDTVRSPQPLGADWVYQQHFAVQQGRVVYSEQCLSPSVCFKFKHLGLIQ